MKTTGTGNSGVPAFFICPNGCAKQFLSSVYSTWDFMTFNEQKKRSKVHIILKDSLVRFENNGVIIFQEW